MRFQSKARSWAPFAIGAATGLLMWFGSPLLFGASEPWDAEDMRYFGAMFALGVAFGAVWPDRFWIGPWGIYVGQSAFGIASWLKSSLFYDGGGVNFFVPLGVIFLVWATLPAFAGAFLVALSLRFRSWSSKRSSGV